MLASVTAYAETLNAVSIEQIEACLPEINAYIYITDVNGEPLTGFAPGEGDVSAILGGNDLRVNSVRSAKGCDTSYYYLIDVSTSVGRKALSDVTDKIAAKIRTASSNEKIVVITFGKEIKVVVDGSENKDKAVQKVKALEPVERATRLFDGIDKMLNLCSNDDTSTSRKVAVLVSDGADLYESGATKDDVLDRIQHENVALYSLALPNSGTNGISAMRDFSKKAGGDIFRLGNGSISSDMDAMYRKLESAYVLNLFAENNIVKGSAEDLVIKLVYKNEPMEAMTSLSITRWMPDEEKPSFSAETGEALNKVNIAFSEKVNGADVASNYIISADDGKKTYGVVSVTYNPDDCTAILTTDKDIYNGEYTVSVSNVTDVSMEKNQLSAGSVQMTVDDPGRKVPYGLESMFVPYWYITALIIAAVAAVAVFGVLAARKNRARKLADKRAEDEKNASSMRRAVEEGIDGKIVQGSGIGNVRFGNGAGSGKKITLVINEENGTERSVDVMVADQFTMGRSKSANLSFADKAMSREHCALAYRDGTLLAIDLGSTNGTTINGIKIKGQYSVNDGDVLRFGKTKITVRFAK